MKFHPRRPTITAAQFDGSTESLNSILILSDPSSAPAYIMTNGNNGPQLTVRPSHGSEWTMQMHDWYVLTSDDSGPVGIVMSDPEFRRAYEPAELQHDIASQLKNMAEVQAAPASQQMIEMQALQLRGTALEAALRLSTPDDSADGVIKEAELFKHYLTGSNPAPAAE